MLSTKEVAIGSSMARIFVIGKSLSGWVQFLGGEKMYSSKEKWSIKTCIFYC